MFRVDSTESAISNAAETLKEINSMKDVKTKLLDGSDSQYGLVKILGMLDASYKTLINSLNDFIMIKFDTPEDRNSARRVLLDGKMGITRAQLQGARSRCSTIEDIYHEFLANWFVSKEFEVSKLKAIKSVFEDKLNHDTLFFKEVDEISSSLRENCSRAYEFVLDGDYPQAKKIVDEFSKQINTSLDRLSAEWQELSTLESDLRENLKYNNVEKN